MIALMRSSWAEADALEEIAKAGYEIEFRLIPDEGIGSWNKFKEQFGY